MIYPVSKTFAIICGLLLVFILPSQAQEVREWKTGDGKIFNGSWVASRGQSVTIKATVGIVTLPYANLSAADQLYLSQLKPPAKKTANPGVPSKGLPPGMSRTGTVRPLSTGTTTPVANPENASKGMYRSLN